MAIPIYSDTDRSFQYATAPPDLENKRGRKIKTVHTGLL